ncbi:MAG: PEGA domain-containing protein [Deltaproteobacteria bacterium]|nr:PEGA domain-containing protein [Deltaproteobacteria bacterium]
MRLLAALALCLVARGAAGAEPDLLLESRAGDRPIEMDLYLSHVVRAASDRPLLQGPALHARIAARLGGVARDATEDEAAALFRAVDDGHEAFVRHDFGTCIKTLDRAAAELAARDALLGRDRRARLALERARLSLAHAYLRTGRPRDAAMVMAEVLRAVPGREPSPRSYSPEVIAFHRRVRADLDGQPRGTLKVQTRPEGAHVFIGGEYIGRSPVRVPDVFPGRYRIVAQTGDRPGRVHEVPVASGEQELVLDLELDSALTRDAHPALAYPEADARTLLEIGHATALGRALGAREVILVGVGSQQGRPALMGTVVAVDSARTVRAGFVTLEPAAPDRATLESFGRFLRVGAPGPGVVVQVGAATAPPSPSPAPRRGARAWLRWVGLGVGLVLAATGGALLWLDGRGTCSAPPGVTCPDHYQTKVPGGILVGTGAALAVASGVVLVLRLGEGGRVALTPQPGGALLRLALRF